MDRLYHVVTFDCYGTLVDWNAGLGNALSKAAGAARPAVDGAARLLAAYHELEPVVEAESRRSYREILIETAQRAVRRCGWEMSLEAAAYLPDSLPNWPLFPDTNAALERLYAAGYRLGILSNVDDDLLAGTRRHFSVPFELIVTAQRVGSYKPALGHFQTARRLIGDARWLHAAQSYFHDIVPARMLGIPVAWINRLDEQASGIARPDREFSDLAGFADWLAPLED